MTEDFSTLSDRELEQELIRQDERCSRIENIHFRPVPGCNSRLVELAQARYAALDAEIERRSKQS